VRFPATEKIDPMVTPGTIRVGYVVVAEPGQYFSSKHKRAVEDALRAKFQVTKLKLQGGTSDGKERLAVIVEPSDSLGGGTMVYETLRELFRPTVQYSAVLLMQSPSRPKGRFKIGMQVLGDPDEDTLMALEERLRAMPNTAMVQRDTSDEGRHFTITAAGTWKEVTTDYHWTLLEHAGITSCMLLNSQR